MYDYRAKWENSTWGSSYADEWPSLIKSQLIPGTILDLGCGTGRFSGIFDSKGYLGADFPKAVESARCEHPKHKYKVLDIITDKIPKADNIFCWTVLEHIPVEEIDQVMDKILKAGKNVICTEPDGFTNEITSYCHCHDYAKYGLKVVHDFGNVKMWRNI
jgi:SAM-dependent methyltransferase